MKKLLRWNFLALLLMVGILSGCQQQLEVTDYSYTPTLQKFNEGDIYPNSNIPVRLSIASNSDAITKEDISVTLKEIKGSGLLYPEGSTTPVEVGIKIAHKFSTSLNYNFIPSTAGDVTLRFTLEHGKTSKDVDLNFTVNLAAYFANIIDKPDNIVVGEPYTMKVAIVENEDVINATRAAEGTPSNKFKVTAEMIEGLGVLKIKDKVLINITETLLAPVLATQNKSATKVEQPSIELTKDEVVSMQYLSMSQEKNRFAINIADQYGNVVNNTVLFIATPPPVALSSTIKADSTYQVGAPSYFFINIANTSTTSNNEYKLDWSFHKDNKVTDLQMFNADAKPVPIGTPVKINHLVTNKFFFNSTVVGLRYITLNVTDKFGITTSYNDTINIAALPVNYKIDLENKGIQTYVAHKFVGTLTAPISSNKYNIEYSVSGEKINPKNVFLKIDDKTYTSGTKIPITPGQQQFEVRLDSAGVYKVNFLVSDNYDQKLAREITLTGVTTGLNISTTPPAKINFGSSAPMEVIVPTFYDHIESYKAMVQFDDGSAAAITVNGQSITPAVEFPLKKGTNAWIITPNKINTECAFTITYKTNFGQEEKKRIAIPLVLPKLTATVENTKTTADLTESLLYNLIVTEPNYTEAMTVTVKYLTGQGTLSIGGKTVANEETTTISRPGTTIISFKPIAIGAIKIELRVADKLNQSQVVYLEGVASQSPFTVTLQSSTTDIKYQTATPATLSIAQALFTGNYEVIATSTKGGTLKVGGKVQTCGSNFPLKNGVHNIEFTPTQCGENIIKFEVKDKIHGDVTRPATITYNVTPYPLVVAVPSQSATEVNRTESMTFALSIDEEFAPTTPYILHYSTAKGGGTLKLGSDVVAPNADKTLTKGTHTFVYTPTVAGLNTLNLEVEDMFGQKKAVTVNVTANHNSLVVSSTPTVATYVNNNATVNVSVAEDSYTGSFHLKYTTNKNGTLTNGGATITPGAAVTIAKGTTALSYKPLVSGPHTLEFTVTDDFGQEQRVKTYINAQFAELKVSSTPTVATYVNNNATVNVSVAEDSYTGSFHLKYTTNKNGTLTNGGATITPGAAIAIAKGTTALSYKPLVSGPHTLEFMVTDDFGQEQRVQTYIDAQLAAIVATPSVSSLNATINSPSAFTVATSEAGYSGGFKISYASNAPGILSVNGSTLLEGTQRNIANGTTTLSYIPTAAGSHSLTFTVSDNNGQNSTFNVTINAAHTSLSFTSNFTSASGFESRATNVSVNTSGAAPIKVKYSGGNGTMRRNSSVVNQNTDITVSANETWQYTPHTTGAHSLTFTATDKNGQTKTANTSYTANVSTVNLSMSEPNSTVVKHNVVSSTVRASNSAGDNSFTYTYSGSFNGSVTPASGSNHTTNTTFQFTPNTIGTHTINITVTDTYGKSATTTWTINSVAAEINASISAGTPNYLGFAQALTIDINKPDYNSDYTVQLSSSNSGSFDRPSFNCGSGRQTINYTPTAVGNHTITATITDREGKSKSVSTLANYQHSSPSGVLARSEIYENDGGTTDWVHFPKKVIITVKNISYYYPAGSQFTVRASGTGSQRLSDSSPSGTFLPTWSKVDGYYETTIYITDRWGNTNSTRIDQKANSGGGGGGIIIPGGGGIIDK